MADTVLAPRRTGLGVGPVRLYQAITVEAAIAASLVSWGFAAPVPYIVTPLALLVITGVVLATLRGQGYHWMLAIRRRRLHKGAEEPAAGTDPLSALQPGLRIVGVDERHTECGVAFDGTGWFTGIELREADATAPAGFGSSAIEVISGLLTDPNAAVSGIQLVNHLVPTPSSELDAESECARSYAELLQDVPVVSHRMSWLALRLDIPTASSTAAERGGGSTGARRAVTSMTVRLAKRLTDAGVPHRLLGPDGLRVALTHSVSGETVSAELDGGAAERWDRWRLGMLAQVCFGVEGPVSDMDSLRGLWTAMASVPASFVTISTAFQPPEPTREHHGVWMRSILRVAYDQELNAGVPDRLMHAANDCGVRLWRCDGEQAAATYASAPTGGAFTR